MFFSHLLFFSINTVVQEAWAGKNVYVLLSKIGPQKIFFADINKTAPNNELESKVRYSAIEIVHIKFSLPLLIPHCFDSLFKVINAYMRLLVRRHNEQSKEQTFQIDTFEMTSIWNGKKSKLKVGLHCFIYVPI